MEDAPKLFKIPKSECPDIWIRLPRHKWPKSWSSMEDPVVPLERNLYGHPFWQDYYCETFCLLCDTIDDSGVSTQRHDDEDKCAK